MKLKIIIFLFFVTSGLSAMQPMQWLRDVAPTVQAELQAEDAAHATEELRKLAEKFYFKHADKKELFDTTKRLLKSGANPNVITQADPAVANYALALAIPENPQIVELLLQARADPNTIEKMTNDPVIFSAIYYNSPTIVKTLLDYKADPNQKASDTRTPLLYAIDSEKKPAIVDLLLQYHADPNISDRSGMTPLTQAIKKENIYIIKLLLQADADPDSINRESLNEGLAGEKKAIYQLILNLLNMYSAQKKAKIL